MARVGVVLSGCGVKDGAEIHESVLTLLALSRRGATAVCCAPDVAQRDVVNHLTGEVARGETRNVLVESARIARGDVRDVASVKAADVDALVFPGGFGAAKNLCSFATDGAKATVHPGVARLVREVHAAGKPIAAICIAPALIAACLRDGKEKAVLTIGNDPGTAKALQAMGQSHEACPVDRFVVDRERKIITTPAYMLARTIAEAATGIERTIDALLEMCTGASGPRR